MKVVSLAVAGAWAALVLGGCMMGPDPETVRCYQACGRQKDGCMLHAMTVDQIARCDFYSSQCNGVCE
jgi:hypothetical protein